MLILNVQSALRPRLAALWPTPRPELRFSLPFCCPEFRPWKRKITTHGSKRATIVIRETRSAVTAAPTGGNDLPLLAAFTNGTISFDGNHRICWEVRDVWTIELQREIFQTRLACPRDLPWSPEIPPDQVKVRRFVRFPDRFGTGSSAITTQDKPSYSTVRSEGGPTPAGA